MPKPTLEALRLKLYRHLTSMTFNFFDYTLSIRLVQHAQGTWSVYDNGGPSGGFPFKFMDGTTGGGDNFPTRGAAEDEVIRIVQYMQAPLTPREIRRHFQERWIRGEEQAEELRRFKTCLLNKQYDAAARIYNKEFSNWTRESIPLKVHIQTSLNLTKTPAKAKGSRVLVEAHKVLRT